LRKEVENLNYTTTEPTEISDCSVRRLTSRRCERAQSFPRSLILPGRSSPLTAASRPSLGQPLLRAIEAARAHLERGALLTVDLLHQRIRLLPI
jgi:hypothetical protein